MARTNPKRPASSRWLAGLALMAVVGGAQAQVVVPKMLPALAFTTPTSGLLEGCGVPDQAAVAIRVLNEIPGATYADVPVAAPWCARLQEGVPADTTSTEVLQLDQIDFVSTDGGKTLSAVGADGDLGTLNTREAKASATDGKGGFWSFLKRAPAGAEASASAPAGNAPEVPPPSFSYVVTPDLLLLNRPGGIFAFDRHSRRFCPAAIAQPGGASQRAMYQISDGRVLIVSWSLPERDKPAVQNAVLVVPPSLCPPVSSNDSGS